MSTLAIEHINEFDTLNAGREKINKALDDANAVLREATDKDIISAPEIILARNGEADLKARLDKEHQEVNAQLAQTATDVTDNKRALNYYWKPETQPSARIDEAPNFTNGFVGTSDDYINALFEPLRSSYPSYITRDIVSKDESGQFNIYRYVFSPERYKKTIIIQSCLHGSEVSPMLAMSRFLKYLTEEWEKYPALAYIRENVRIVYTPFANPWGTSQTPRTRQNSRGVDINRNFDYMWQTYTPQANSPFGHDYKGTSANSEAETLAVLKTLNDYPDAMAFLDLHNTGEPSRDIYIALANAFEYDVYDNVINYFTRDIANPDILLQRNNNPNIANYIYNNYQELPVSIPEWCDRRFGGGMFSSTDLTKAVEWFANVIIEHTRGLTGKERVSVIGNVTLNNVVENGNFANGTTSWTLLGTQSTSVVDNTLNTSVGINAPTPFIRETTGKSYVKGERLYMTATVMPPANCNKVELRVRDNTSPSHDESLLIASLVNPVPGQFLTISGIYDFVENYSDASLQIMFYMNGVDNVGNEFKIKNVMAIKLVNEFARITKNEMDAVLSNVNQDYFTTHTIDKFIINSNLLEKHERNLWLSLL